MEKNNNQTPGANQNEQQPLTNDLAPNLKDKTKTVTEDRSESANQPGSRRDNQDHKEDTIGIP